MSEQIFCKTMGSELQRKRVFCSSSIKILQQMGGEVQLLNWWQLRKLVARSAMGCVKLVIPETGFVGEEKFVFHQTGGGLKLGLNQPKSSPEVRFNEKLVERSREVVPMWPLGRGTVI